MVKNKYLSQILGASAVAALMCVSSVHAQTAATDNSTTTTKSTTTTSKTAGKDTGSDAKGGNVSHRDRELMEDIAHANIAEIATGKLALEKGQSEAVKKFAQQMVDDHTKALDELKQLADKKGVSLPTETDLPHKTVSKALEALSGDAFDKQYIARVGVGDHERTHKLLQKTARTAKDADLKAYAQKTIKAVDQHLQMGRKLKGDQKGSKSTKTSKSSNDNG